MPFGSSTPTRSPGASPLASNALPSRSVSESNSRKLTHALAFDEAGRLAEVERGAPN